MLFLPKHVIQVQFPVASRFSLFEFQFEPPDAVIDVKLLINTSGTQYEKLQSGDDTWQDSSLTSITDYSLYRCILLCATEYVMGKSEADMNTQADGFSRPRKVCFRHFRSG
uniref:PPUP7903 n=1 Tax=Poeciliopsis prolifica TaxID=188132 RepID=A0A0S7ESF7_9TELE